MSALLKHILKCAQPRYRHVTTKISGGFRTSTVAAASAIDTYSVDLERRRLAYTTTLQTLQTFQTFHPPSQMDDPMDVEVEMPRNLQIVSDVHLERYRRGRVLPVITPHGHDLALLGDIGQPFDKSYRHFLEQQSKQFENVFLLLGNHEFYSPDGRTVTETIHQTRAVCAPLPNVHLLERDTFDLTGNTRLLGTTLWSSIDHVAARGLNDFNMISTRGFPTRLTAAEYIQWHVRDVAWLEMELARCKKDGKHAVILTHHGPCQAMAGHFQGSPLNPAFVTDLVGSLFKPPAIAFASGHVHSNVDILVNGIRTVSNALGYPGEITGYKEDVIIEIQ